MNRKSDPERMGKGCAGGQNQPRKGCGPYLRRLHHRGKASREGRHCTQSQARSPDRRHWQKERVQGLGGRGRLLFRPKFGFQLLSRQGRLPRFGVGLWRRWHLRLSEVGPSPKQTSGPLAWAKTGSGKLFAGLVLW